MNDFNKEEKERFLRGQLISFGWTMTGGMIIFAGLGYLVDLNSVGEFSWTLLGIALGLFYGGYELWKLVQLINKEDS